MSNKVKDIDAKSYNQALIDAQEIFLEYLAVNHVLTHDTAVEDIVSSMFIRDEQGQIY